MYHCAVAKLVAPPRPVATKSSDTSARLEWPEYRLDGATDLGVTFIKVQYRETASSAPLSRTWSTLDDDLDPSTTSHVVTGLKPGISYRQIHRYFTGGGEILKCVT